MLNKTATHELKGIRPALARREATGVGWLWGALSIHAIIMAWLISLIF